MVKLQTIDFIRNAGRKKAKAFAYRVPIECLQGTIIIHSEPRMQIIAQKLEQDNLFWVTMKP